MFLLDKYCIDGLIVQKALYRIEAPNDVAFDLGISMATLYRWDVSRLLKGQFREISVERIMRILTRLGCEVDIVIKLPGRTLSGSVIHLQHAQSEAV